MRQEVRDDETVHYKSTDQRSHVVSFFFGRPFNAFQLIGHILLILYKFRGF